MGRRQSKRKIFNSLSGRRTVAIGYLGERLHFLCFTVRGDAIGVISFRKVNSREIREYEKKKAAHR